MNELMVYLKTTETCQLNCEHCFTSGSQGKKVFFNPDKTISFFKRLKEVVPNFKKGGHISFHGGEPMLAPVEDMLKVYREVSPLWSEVWWGIQTNLTYRLDDNKIAFFDEVLKRNSFGTSWDYKIRFPNRKAEELWESNVRTLVKLGYPVTVMVSVTSKTLELEPKQIIEKMIELGVTYINFERMTPNGNARSNNDLAAGNKNLQDYFLKMWEQTIENKYYEKIQNLFFNSILSPLVHSTHSGCRCRTCEQKIFTLNADGTVGGCPNSAVEKPYGYIDYPILEIMYSKGRMKEISCEAVRNPGCYGCDVFDICNGDCHQLAWDGDVCPAPKTLMQKLKYNKEFPYGDATLMGTVLNGFIGQE
jgi:radical SAM protein with 4Fe4S-binding SPASM domain